MENNIFELINEISTISFVEGVEEKNLPMLKLKAIELFSAYAKEKGKNGDLWKYSIVDTPDFGAFIFTDKSTSKTSLAFRQELNETVHHYFSSAEDILKAMNHLYGNQLRENQTSEIKK